MRRVKTWTCQEEEFLARNSESMSHRELARVLGRTIGSVSSKITEMGLTSAPASLFTAEMDEVIIREGTLVAAARFGLPRAKVNSRRQYLKRKGEVPPEFWVIAPPPPPEDDDAVVQRWIPATAAPMPRTNAPRSVFELTEAA